MMQNRKITIDFSSVHTLYSNVYEQAISHFNVFNNMCHHWHCRIHLSGCSVIKHLSLKISDWYLDLPICKLSTISYQHSE